MAKVAPAGLPVKPSPARNHSSMRVWPSLGFPGPAQQLTHTAGTLCATAIGAFDKCAIK